MPLQIITGIGLNVANSEPTTCLLDIAAKEAARRGLREPPSPLVVAIIWKRCCRLHLEASHVSCIIPRSCRLRCHHQGTNPLQVPRFVRLNVRHLPGERPRELAAFLSRVLDPLAREPPAAVERVCPRLIMSVTLVVQNASLRPEDVLHPIVISWKTFCGFTRSVLPLSIDVRNFLGEMFTEKCDIGPHVFGSASVRLS